MLAGALGLKLRTGKGAHKTCMQFKRQEPRENGF
jgi:hypothetical protein